MLRHPFGAGQVRIKCTFCAIMLKLGINMQHDLRYLPPVRSLSVCIEHAQISNNMFLVVDSQHGIRWRNIGNVWISWGFFHKASEPRDVVNHALNPTKSKPVRPFLKGGKR